MAFPEETKAAPPSPVYQVPFLRAGNEEAINFSPAFSLRNEEPRGGSLNAVTSGSLSLDAAPAVSSSLQPITPPVFPTGLAPTNDATAASTESTSNAAGENAASLNGGTSGSSADALSSGSIIAPASSTTISTFSLAPVVGVASSGVEGSSDGDVLPTTRREPPSLPVLAQPSAKRPRSSRVLALSAVLEDIVDENAAKARVCTCCDVPLGDEDLVADEADVTTTTSKNTTMTSTTTTKSLHSGRSLPLDEASACSTFRDAADDEEGSGKESRNDTDVTFIGNKAMRLFEGAVNAPVDLDTMLREAAPTASAAVCATVYAARVDRQVLPLAHDNVLGIVTAALVLATRYVDRSDKVRNGHGSEGMVTTSSEATVKTDGEVRIMRAAGIGPETAQALVDGLVECLGDDGTLISVSSFREFEDVLNAAA